MSLRSKLYIGFLNKTLRGIRQLSGKDMQHTAARYIAEGILWQIPSNQDSKIFIDYCDTQYNIKLNKKL